MRRLVLATALLLAGCGQDVSGNGAGMNTITILEAKRVVLTAADGVQVFGKEVTARGAPKAMILLFHQAGSSKDEYTPIALRLAEAGYSSLAIDQRSGGSLYGTNETARSRSLDDNYLSARQDLEAALAWAKNRKLPVVLWGSSYSASLAFLVAAEHQDEVAALLAFSPDEYFDGMPSVRAAAAGLTIPVFVTSARDDKEIAAAKALLDAVPAKVKDQFVPVHGGVHGSSTLRGDRNAGGAEDAWRAVLGFLDTATRR